MNRHLGTVAFVALPVGVWIAAGALPGCAAESRVDTEVPDAMVIPLDAGSDVEDATTSSDAGPPPGCSDDGWCRETYPDGVEPGVSLSAVWGSSANDVWAVGSGGTILHFDGTRWARVSLGDAGRSETFFTVWGSGPSDVWIGSTERVMLHSEGWKNGQATFSLIEGDEAWRSRLDAAEWSAPPGAFRVWNVWGSSADDVWMVGVDSIRAWRADGYRDGAVNWAAACDYFPKTDIQFMGIWGSPARDVWLVGSEGKLLHAPAGYPTNGLVDWEIDNSGTSKTLRAIWGSAEDDVYTVGNLGTIRHRTYDPSGTLGWIASASGTDADLLAVWGSGPNDVWTVGDGSTLLHGDGSAWLPSTPPTLDAPSAFRGVWGSATDDVWVVGDGVLLHRGKRPTEVVP